MSKNSSKIISLCVLLIIFSALSSFTLIKPVAAAQPMLTWWNVGWKSCISVNLTETAGRDRVSEPTDVHIALEPGTMSDPNREVRVLHFDGSAWTEVTSQVYNITWEEDSVKSCNVVFLADCPANNSTMYYIYYNNPNAKAPVYDGLRLRINKTGDWYNVTAVKDIVEKNYFYLFWKNAVNLYSNGKLVTWAGGPLGWNFSQIGLGALWADAGGTAWFGAGKSLSVLSSGPLFVDFNYTEAFASDLWGAVFDYNVTTTNLIRVWYQQDLNPLVHYRSSFFIHPVSPLINYTIKTPYYLDFKLANSIRRAIYEGFTWKNIAGVTRTTPVETNLTDSIWSPESPVGWWSYNGSRSDSADKPAANMGLIPIYSGGTIAGADYTLNVTQLLDPYETLPPEPQNHHCSQHFKGAFNGAAGDTIETEGYIVVNTPVDQNVASTMEEKANKLRYPEPLQATVGEPLTLAYEDRRPPNISGVVPVMVGQEIVEGTEVNVSATVTDNPGVIIVKNETVIGTVVGNVTVEIRGNVTAIVRNVTAIPASGVDNVFMNYSTDGGLTWEKVNMAKVGETDVYTGLIPGFKAGTKVTYKIIATDRLGNRVTSPTYWYKVRIPSRTGIWFTLGISVGSITTLIIVAAAVYARKKT